ncbi:hypothetical protein CRYUN_Cryun32bG0075300 [Craigia yunnanensis]
MKGLQAQCSNRQLLHKFVFPESSPSRSEIAKTMVQGYAIRSVMDVEMETSPSYFDPQDHSAREKFRRYGKRNSSSSISPRQENGFSKFNEAKLLYEGLVIHSPTKAALLLENIKQEAESFDTDYFEETPAMTRSASKRRPSNDGH